MLKSNKTKKSEIIENKKNIAHVSQIIHMADIHIKNDQSNRSEYDSVFNELYTQIKKTDKLDETIIVICGDIFDNKTNLRPESIDQLSNFFHELNQITDVIVILGNHDRNMNNSSSLDAITPIISKQKTKFNTVILKESCIYEYSNIMFAVTDIFAQKPTNFPKTNKHKIHLYHGYIHGSTIQNGSVGQISGRFNQNDFSDADITLLGDIHKFQYVNKNKTMAYPSSLLQLNYGEDIHDHGYILWNLKNKDSEYIRIKNDFCYYTVNVKDYDTMPKLPKNVRLRVIYDEINNKKDEIITEFYKNYNVIQLDEIKQINNVPINALKTITNNTQINCSGNIIDIIMHYMSTNMKISETMTKEINSELINITKELNYDFTKTKKNIKLHSLNFNNMFLFGEGNEVNFDNLSKIVGLIADNKRGKTSLIDCILFSIWSESDRTISNIDILKFGKKKMNSTIVLTVNDVKYKISRNSFISKSKMYNELSIYKYDEEKQEFENISEQDKKNTENKIISLVGTSDELTLLSVITQDNPINFVTMKDCDKKALLIKIFNLDIIKDITKHVNRESIALAKSIKELNNTIIHLNEQQLIDLSHELKQERTNTTVALQTLSDQKEETDKQLNNCEFEVGKLQMPNELIDIDKIKKQFDRNNKNFNRQLEEINMIKENIRTNNKQKKQLKNELNEEEILGKNEEWVNKKERDLVQLEQDYEKLNENKRPIFEISSSDILRTDKLKIKINKLKKQLVIMSDNPNINVNKDEYDECEKIITIYEKNIELVSKTENEQNEIKIQINKTNNDIRKTDDHEYNPNCIECMKNPVTRQKLFLTDKLKDLNKELGEKISLIQEKQSYISKRKNKYENAVEKVNNYKVNLLNIENNKQINEQINESNVVVSEYENKVTQNEKNNEHNESINKQIKENRKKQKTLNILKNDEYELYLVNIEKIKQLTDDNEQLKEQILELENDNKMKLEKINEYNTIINKYNDAKENYELKKKLDILVDDLTDKKKKLMSMINFSQSKIIDLTHKISKCETELEQLKNTKILITNNTKKKEMMQIIKNTTDNGGLLDDIIGDTILPIIEMIVNNILNTVDNYKIKLSYPSSSVRITKIENENDNESCGLMASGHEKSILNIIFRLALTKINTLQGTNFFIIDEAFKNSDNSKKQKLHTLFEYLRNNYDWCLIVTHDDYIKDNFNSEINIDHDKGTSSIKYI